MIVKQFGLNGICRYLRTLILFLSTIFFFGCANMGPSSIIRDRADFSNSVADSWMRQVLMNIVKIRYLDTPIYLDVSSITTSNSTETSINAGGNIYTKPGGIDFLNFGASGRYTDRPNITYTPLTGSRFLTSLMMPIPPETLFFTINSGWNAEAMFSAAVNSLNGLSNNQVAISGGASGDDNFFEAIRLIEKLKDRIRLNVKRKQTSKDEFTNETHMVISPKPLSKQQELDLTSLKTLLGLRSDENTFKIVLGPSTENNNEIAVQSRSLIQILTVMASEIDVPDEHVSEMRTPRTPKNTKNNIKIHSSKFRPEDALVAVLYRDYWFWIDDRDLVSKRALNLVMILFALAETGEQRLPLITLPIQ